MSAAILTRLSQSYKARKLMERQLFHDSNRREVLALYREVLKAVDRTIPRKLEKEAKLAVSPRFFGLLLYLRGLSLLSLGIQICLPSVLARDRPGSDQRDQDGHVHRP